MNDVQSIPDDADVNQVQQKRPTKLELKRQQIFQERMQRHIAAGKTPEQAFAAVQKEDYERLPVADKVKRLEGLLFGNIQGLAKDLSLLKQNQTSLADVMDVNFRAFEKMLTKLGLPAEEQRKLFEEAEAEVKAELDARRAAIEANQKLATEEDEKKELAASVDQPGTPVVPDGAAVFG